MNEPLVKGGQGRSASGVVSHSLGMAWSALAGGALGCLTVLSLWLGWWLALPVVAVLMLVVLWFAHRADRRRMASELSFQRGDVLMVVGFDPSKGESTAESVVVTRNRGDRLDVEA
jgi:uncharacterized membrane protein